MAPASIRWQPEETDGSHNARFARLVSAPLVILTVFVSAALAVGQLTNPTTDVVPVVERRSSLTEIDSYTDGYVDSVRRFVIGDRDFLVITFWVRWSLPQPVFVWAAPAPTEVAVSTYNRSDLSSIEGAIAATVTASAYSTSTDSQPLCLGIESTDETYFVAGFENCWSFK